MKRYLLKRLLFIIPTLVIISVVAFTLSKMVPQDSAMALLNAQAIEDENPDMDLYESAYLKFCLLYTSPSPRDATLSRMPSSA